jgi:hypothetical protein
MTRLVVQPAREERGAAEGRQTASSVRVQAQAVGRAGAAPSRPPPTAHAHQFAAAHGPGGAARRDRSASAHACAAPADCSEAGAACVDPGCSAQWRDGDFAGTAVSHRHSDRWVAPGGDYDDDECNSADEDDGRNNRAAGKNHEPDIDENELGMLSNISSGVSPRRPGKSELATRARFQELRGSQVGC